MMRIRAADILCPQDAHLGIIPRVCHGSIDFTLAFENYILILIPSALLILLAPVRLRTVWARTVKVVSPTILQAVKTFSALSFAGSSLSVLVVSTGLDQPWRRSEVTAASISFAAAIVCLALSYLEHFRSIRPSVLLQLYLTVTLIVNAVHLRSVWLRSGNIALKATCCSQLGSCLAFLYAESSEKGSILTTGVPRSPNDINNIFNRRLYLWINRLFVAGYRKILKPADLDSIDEDLASRDRHRRFRLEWLKRQDSHLYLILFHSLRSSFLFPIIPKLLQVGINLAQPFLIQRLITYVGDPSAATPNEGPLLVLAGFCVYAFTGIFATWYGQSSVRLETKCRAVLITAVHDKVLRAEHDTQHSPLMHMNVDVDKAVDGIRYQNEYWATTISLIVALVLLKQQVGLSFLAPTLLLVIIALILGFNSNDVAPKQKAFLGATQKRVTFVTSTVATMKNIKLMGLVRVVQCMGTNLREQEIHAQRDVRMTNFLNLMISQFVFQASAVLMFGGYAISVRLGAPPLNVASLFTSLALLKLFTSPMIATIQEVPQSLAALAAMSRLQTYLRVPEHEDRRREMSASERAMNDGSENLTVLLNNVTAGYRDRPEVLRNVNISIDQGKFHFVIGQVASGKSTLLKTIVGETRILQGDVLMASLDASFCDQQPWLWNNSIKENILSGTDLDQAWLDQVTWACGLQHDFSTMTKGANTKAGDDGSALSGGQKNRVALARAIYARKRLFVCDDMLAGLDARTESLVFTRVFGPEGLLRKIGCTTILATHSTGWMSYADKVLIVEAGNCIFQGPPSSVPERLKSLAASKTSGEEESNAADSKALAVTVDEVDEIPEPTPATDGGVYLAYLKSFTVRSCLIYFPIAATPTVASNMLNVILQKWASKNSASSEVMGFYSGMTVVALVLNVVLMTVEIYYAFMTMFPKSSLNLHALQWKALMEVAFSNWGASDNGSIINRFSQDVSLIDTALPLTFLNVSNMVFMFIASLVIISVASPYVLASFPFAFGMLYLIQKIYLKTSKQLRILDLEAKAPICTHFLLTVSGAQSIRAYGWTNRNQLTNQDLLEASQAPYYLLEMAQMWLQLVLSQVVTGMVTVLLIVTVALSDRLNSGLLGLSLLNFMDLGPLLKSFVSNWTTFDTSLGAVVRVRQFCRSMPQEEQGSIEVDEKWLQQGIVELKGLTASYSPTAPPTLKDVDLTFAPGKKIAICGRTGSGKSSLASALFGLLHISSGSILIDGIDISLVSQDELRSRMVALPQDPFFLPATVRVNLAPREFESETVSDEDMLSALAKVGLADAFPVSGPEVLDLELKATDMLTRGQQQLFAMARTLLSKGSIVVIDEATSGLDSGSDEKVQKLIRAELKGRTVVAVAHRLDTIMDFDTVVVMEAGKVMEVGRPDVLARKKGGWFWGLVQAHSGGEGH